MGLAALECPDILAYFWALEHFEWRHLPWAGGYDDQPHLTMFELDCVGEALKLQEQLDKQQALVAASAVPKVTM